MTPNKCKRCGTCCKNGGPALHVEDMPLLTAGYLATDKLITIRRGEPVFSPLTNKIEPAAMELVKLAGVGNSWVCCFYQDGDSACGIYKHRPLECRILKCWDTAELTKMIFQNTISRADIIGTTKIVCVGKDHAINEMINRHEQECPYEKLQLASEMKEKRESIAINVCRQIINNDLAIRQEAVRIFDLSLAQELFYFGRPMFKSLSFFGLEI